MRRLAWILFGFLAVSVWAQETESPPPLPAVASGYAEHLWGRYALLFRPAPPPAPPIHKVAAGTRILLVLVNSVGTRNAHEGDEIYLRTAFPVFVGNKMVIPAGSCVHGTMVQAKGPGRSKGRGQMYLRFDTLNLPNGVAREFRGRVAAVNGSGVETPDKREGAIQGDSSAEDDAAGIVGMGLLGAFMGGMAADGGDMAEGALIGGLVGLAAGIIGALVTRGPDITLARGAELTMVLDRDLVYADDDLRFEGPGGPRTLEALSEPPRRPY